VQGSGSASAPICPLFSSWLLRRLLLRSRRLLSSQCTAGFPGAADSCLLTPFHMPLVCWLVVVFMPPPLILSNPPAHSPSPHHRRHPPPRRHGHFYHSRCVTTSPCTVTSHSPGLLLRGFSSRRYLLTHRLVVVLHLVAPPSRLPCLVEAFPSVAPPPPLDAPAAKS
jgi:hypothetical protein